MKREKRTVEDLLQDMMIIQLGSVGMSQHQIREIVGVDMNKVTRILKHFKGVRKGGVAK